MGRGLVQYYPDLGDWGRLLPTSPPAACGLTVEIIRVDNRRFGSLLKMVRRYTRRRVTFKRRRPTLRVRMPRRRYTRKRR